MYCRDEQFVNFLCRFPHLLNDAMLYSLIDLFLKAEDAYTTVNIAQNHYRYKFFDFNFVTHKLLRATGRFSLARRFPLRFPYYTANMHWADMCVLVPELSGDAILVQSLVRRRLARRHVAATRIQRRCHSWLWKTRTRDGKLGINVRLLLKDFADADSWPKPLLVDMTNARCKSQNK